MKRSTLIRKTRLSPKLPKLKKEVPEWKRVSGRVRSETQGPERDPAFLAFVRQHSCLVERCCSRRIEAHHFGKRAKGTKCSDYQTVPLCRDHHREFHDRGSIGETGRAELVARWTRWATVAVMSFLTNGRK